jgi:hypothetical protein
MRILLDEDLPRSLGKLLTGHEPETVPRCGWSGVKNGKLLALAATRFDVFLTMDQNIEFQQNLATLPIAILEGIRGQAQLILFPPGGFN